MLPYPGADYHIPNKEEELLYIQTMIAIKNNDYKTFNKFINLKKDVNKKVLWYSKDDNTFVPEQSMLSIAARYGRVNMAKNLIKKGAKINDYDEYGSEPLHYACFGGNIQMIDLLINHGAEVNKIAEKKYIRLYGENTDKLTGFRDTPLQIACKMGNLKLVKYLISKNANLNIKDNFNRIPYDYVKNDNYVHHNSDHSKIKIYLESL